MTFHLTRFAYAVAPVFALLATPAAAVTLSVPLVFPSPTPSENQLELTIRTAIATDSDTSNLSGNVASQFELELSSSGVEVTGIRFDGGSIAASDVSFFFGTATGTGLGGVLTTPGAGFSPVSSGSFTTGDHILLINEGVLSSPGFQRNLSDDPFEFSSDSGVATIALTQIFADGADRTFRARLTLPINETEQVDSGTQLTAVGNVVGVGQFMVTLPVAGDFNADGVVDSVDYAVWREDFEQGAAPASDFDVWLANYGAGVSGGGAGGSIAAPEPAAGLLGMGGLVWVAAVAGHRRRTFVLTPGSSFLGN